MGKTATKFVLSVFVFALMSPVLVLKFNILGPYMGKLLVADHRLHDQCMSRKKHHFYPSQSQASSPSKYLVLALRRYEALHRKCAPQAAEQLATLVEQLNHSTSPEHSSGDCRFAVWVNDSGLGNNMMTMVATFLYALLTGRVLLVDKGADLEELFCEPFPNSTSWFLPSTFPKELFLALKEEKSPYRFGNFIQMQGGCISNIMEHNATDNYHPPLAYLELAHIYNRHDQRFFCKHEQNLLKRVPLLFLKSNNYFVPGLYHAFQHELDKLFPDRGTIFHHLGRYLLHPSNRVWAKITTFYNKYLSSGDVLVGLQLRPFHHSRETIEKFSDQVLSCVLQKRIIPDVVPELVERSPSKTHSITVLVTSLHKLFLDRLREYYANSSTADGSFVRFFLPSNEEVQKTEETEHDVKALAEIYLLSLSNILVTSPKSTFGYAAQGLAGLKPWQLLRNQSETCFQSILEPCFHASYQYDCECSGSKDPVQLLPKLLRHCSDVPGGIYLLS